MPAAISYIPPTEHERGGFNEVTRKEYDKRKTTYVNALNYYYGYADDPFTADANDPDYDVTVDNTVLDLTRMGADRTVSFLFPEVPKVVIDPSITEETVEEEWVRKKFLEGNGGLPMLTKWALRGFLSGHTFIWVKNKRPTPRIVLLHPLSITAFWAADDISELLWYEQRFLSGGTLYIRDFVLMENGSWEILLYKADTSPATQIDKIISQVTNKGNTGAQHSFDNVTFGDHFKLINTTKHEYINGEVIPPILSTPHLPDPDDFYGMSEFGSKKLLDTINRVASERTRIVRQNADPVDVATGVTPDEIEGTGNLVTIASEKAKVTRLTLSGDLHAVNTTLDSLIEHFLGVMRVVILKGEAKDLQRVTNAAVRTLFLDALAKNAILWASYSKTLAQACELAMAMAYANNILESNPAEKEVTLQMSSPLPVDKSEIANINALAVNAGYRSKRTASTELGDDYNAEVEAIATEFDEGLERQAQTMEQAATFSTEEENNEQVINE